MALEIMVENVWKHLTISGARNVEPGLLLSPSLSRRLRESSVQAMQSRIDRSLIFSCQSSERTEPKDRENSCSAFDCELIDLPSLPFLILFLDVPFNSCVQVRKVSFDNRVRESWTRLQEKVTSLIAPLHVVRA
jgi:hypothetical protein